MSEIFSAAQVAFFGFLSVVLGQIALRIDQSRREMRNSLMAELQNEQSLCENIAYRARRALVHGIDQNDGVSAHGEVDRLLFERVYEQSRLVAMCAELENYGIPSHTYHQNIHHFREKCLKAVLEGIATKEVSKRDSAIQIVMAETKFVQMETRRISKRIHYRFTWV